MTERLDPATGVQGLPSTDSAKARAITPQGGKAGCSSTAPLGASPSTKWEAVAGVTPAGQPRPRSSRTWAIMQKEMRQILRDRRSLVTLLLMPAVIMVLYGYGLSLDLRRLPLWILDSSRSSQSRDFASQFSHCVEFDLKGYLSDPGEIRTYLDSGRARAVMVIPEDFAGRIERGEEAKVQALLDGSDATQAGRAQAYIEGITRGFSASIQTKALLRQGIEPARTMALEPRIWYNPDLKSAEFLLPGLMGYILAIVCVVATALSVARERERGTMEQLAVSPLSPTQLIVGKVAPYILIAFITASLVLLTGVALFGVHVRGNPLILFMLLVVYTTCNLGLGLLISSMAKDQQAAFQGALLISVLPAMILSGFIYPIRSMPAFLRGITYLVPARYFLVALRGVVLKGSGMAAVWEQVACLVALSVITLGISARLIRRRLFGM